MSDKEFYQIIADELKFKTMDSALWTQAIATAEGNPDKTEALYIRLRFLDLKKSALSSLQLASLEPGTANPEAKAPDAQLLQLRAQLARKILSQNRPSLYSILGLQPDASDAIVASAIADIESRGHESLASAEFKYAKNTLGNSNLREQYDRKLFESTSSDYQRTPQAYAGQAFSDDDSWFGLNKSFIVSITVIVLLGYFSLTYYKERNNRESQKESIGVQRDALTSTTETNQTLVQTEQMKAQADIEFRNQALRMVDERQRQDLQYRANTTDRLFEQRRQEQERREIADQQRIKLQQDQVEAQKISMERQYNACLNQQLLSSREVTQSDAFARCSMYRR